MAKTPTTETPLNFINNSSFTKDLDKDLMFNFTNEEITMSKRETKSTTNFSKTITTANPLLKMDTESNDNSNVYHPGIKFQHLSIATVAAFLFISNIGWVALNQVICAELLPREIHRSANMLIVSFSFLSAFISIKMFADLVQSLDAGHTFYLFGGICGFAALFTLLFVPETSQH